MSECTGINSASVWSFVRVGRSVDLAILRLSFLVQKPSLFSFSLGIVLNRVRHRVDTGD